MLESNESLAASAAHRPRHAGVLRVSFDLLAQLLGLPEGHTIADVECHIADRMIRQCEVLVTGPMMPEVPHRERPRPVVATVRHDDCSRDPGAALGCQGQKKIIEFQAL